MAYYFQDPYIKALKKENRGEVPDTSAPILCPLCGNVKSSGFSNWEALQLHWKTKHAGEDPGILDEAKLLISQRISKANLQSWSGTGSPASVKATFGSRGNSRESSPLPDSDGRRLSPKRPFPENPNHSEHIAKHQMRKVAENQPQQPSTGARLGAVIRPEDVRRNPNQSRIHYDQGLPKSHAKVGVGTSKHLAAPDSVHVGPRTPNVPPTSQPFLPGRSTMALDNFPSTPSNQNNPSRPSTNRISSNLNLRYKPQWPLLALQPQSRPVYQEHLAAEVKTIYTGLTEVETKCVHIDKVQQATPRSESTITDDHWQAMIALHRTLLHEHHDFFLASQHPAASPALKRLAIKYSMPARMWKHGIHSFLELLRHRLPESLEYMLAFIYLAYQMIALLYETVPTFRNTWIECLGDIARYRMAVEDANVRDREIWAGVARGWYNRAADTNPAVGRLYHHLAILARPNLVQQLYLYNRSLTSVMPFMNARESIVTILEPALQSHLEPAFQSQLASSQDDTSLWLLKVHAHLFKKNNLSIVRELLESNVAANLPAHIERIGDRWLHLGAYIAIANLGSLFDYGNEQSRVRFIFDYRRKVLQLEDPQSIPPGLPEDQSVPNLRSFPVAVSESEESFYCSIHLIFSVFKAVLSRQKDNNVLPFVHVMLVFLLHLSQISILQFSVVSGSILEAVPWNDLVAFINTLNDGESGLDLALRQSIVFDDSSRPLPEDWMLRGLSWSFNYSPPTWFKNAAVTEEEERYMELTSTMKARLDRVLSLTVALAQSGDWIRFDEKTGRFSLVPKEEETGVGGSPHTEGSGAEDLGKIQRKHSSLIVGLGVLKEKGMVVNLPSLRLPIVVSSEAVDELLRDNTESALVDLFESLQGRSTKILIKTPNGENRTEEYRSKLQSSLASLKTAPVKSRVNTVREIDMIGIARQESDLTFNSSRTNTTLSLCSTDTEMTEPDPEGFRGQSSYLQDVSTSKKPLLVTDDRDQRLQASGFGTASIAITVMKKWLSQARRSSLVKAETEDPAMEIDIPAQDVPMTGGESWDC